MEELLKFNQLSQDFWNNNIDLRNIVIFASIIITAIFIIVKAKVKYESLAIMILLGCIVLVPIVVLSLMSVPVIALGVLVFLGLYLIMFNLIRLMQHIEEK